MLYMYQTVWILNYLIFFLPSTSRHCFSLPFQTAFCMGFLHVSLSKYIPTYFATCVSTDGLSDKIHPVGKLDIDEMLMLFEDKVLLTRS